MSDEKNGNGTDLEKLISRIQKLLALSTSPNENEAMSAMAKVQELLATHNLSMSDLDQNVEDDAFVKDEDLVTDTAAWVRPFLSEVGKLYFCGYFYVTLHRKHMAKESDDRLKKASRSLLAGGHAASFLRHTFVGAKHNIVVAKSMSEYLISTMEQLCKAEMKSQPAAMRSSFAVSFMNACSARLRARIYERRMETSKQETKMSDGRNLPALNNIYEDARAKYDQWLKDEDIALRSKASRARSSNLAGIMAGREAGNSISLDGQISGAGNVRRIK